MRTPLAALVLFLCTACLCRPGLAQDRTLTLYTSLAPTESGPLAQAFEKKTGIKVELWRAISEKVVQRAITEARARRFAVDVVETNAPEMEMMARDPQAAHGLLPVWRRCAHLRGQAVRFDGRRAPARDHRPARSHHAPQDRLARTGSIDH